jgi:hypothetical protein
MGDRIAGMERPCRTGAAGVFPFGLGREAVRDAFLFAQPLAKGHGVVPGDLRYGVIVEA